MKIGARGKGGRTAGGREGGRERERRTDATERELVVYRGATSQRVSGDGESEVVRACGYP